METLAASELFFAVPHHRGARGVVRMQRDDGLELLNDYRVTARDSGFRFSPSGDVAVDVSHRCERPTLLGGSSSDVGDRLGE